MALRNGDIAGRAARSMKVGLQLAI